MLLDLVVLMSGSSLRRWILLYVLRILVKRLVIVVQKHGLRIIEYAWLAGILGRLGTSRMLLQAHHTACNLCVAIGSTILSDDFDDLLPRLF